MAICKHGGMTITVDGVELQGFADGSGTIQILKQREHMKKFTKSDLKDGMVVTYRTGFSRVVLDGKLFKRYKEHDIDRLTNSNGLYKYQEDLNHNTESDLDIVKVEYMGEVLWRRQILVELDDKLAMKVLIEHGPVPCQKREDSESFSHDTLVGVDLAHKVGKDEFKYQFNSSQSGYWTTCWVDKKYVEGLNVSVP